MAQEVRRITNTIRGSGHICGVQIMARPNIVNEGHEMFQPLAKRNKHVRHKRSSSYDHGCEGVFHDIVIQPRRGVYSQ